MPPEFDEHILATMTDEERALILEPQSPEEVAAIAAVDSGAEDGPDEEDDEPEVDAAPAAEPAAAPADKAETAPPTSPATDTTADASEAPEKAFQPVYQAALPADYDEKVAALKEQSDALAEKFKAGGMEFDAYRVEADALAKESRALEELAFKASLAQDMKAQTVEQQWAFTVSKFMATTAKAEGIDYKTDTEKSADLDMFVKALANDPKHADKPGEWFLTEGHKRVKAMHGIGQASPAPAPADPTASRKTPLAAAPKTLAQVPGGDGPGDVDGNEFSDVDRLTGDALESAIAKMTPAQRDRYMAGV